MDRLSAFNKKINQHYWQVKNLQPPHDNKPCFTREEMRNFAFMREDEIRWCFSARLEDGFIEIVFPKDWSIFRAQEGMPDMTMAQKKSREILEMLRGRTKVEE